MVFSLNLEEWMKFQQVEMEAEESPAGREDNLCWQAESSGRVQGRMSIEILVSF